jgi:hypothetical protein
MRRSRPVPSSSIGAMQEFSSVTASSYDADSLTPMLNEKAADGWEVVSIVSAGTNIVAYLSRESDGATAVDSAGASDEIDAGPAAAAAAAAGTPTLGEVATPDASPEAEEAPTEDASTPETPTEDAPAEEPAGWAAAPETSETTDDSIASLAAQVGAEDAAAGDTPVLGTTEPAAAPEPEPEPEPAPAAEAAPAAEPAVPAGWYADPSGRFELRYWDGSAWTEHVSRAGQQFTDPPVA